MASGATLEGEEREKNVKKAWVKWGVGLLGASSVWTGTPSLRALLPPSTSAGMAARQDLRGQPGEQSSVPGPMQALRVASAGPAD